MIKYKNHNKILACPSCKSKLRHLNDKYECINAKCGLAYPIVNKIPVLINEINSAFQIKDFISNKETANVKKKPALDAAATCYFLGSKTESII